MSRGKHEKTQHITGWVHVTRPAAATGAGTQNGKLGKGAGHPSAELTLGSRGVMNRQTLSDRHVCLAGVASRRRGRRSARRCLRDDVGAAARHRTKEVLNSPAHEQDSS